MQVQLLISACLLGTAETTKGFLSADLHDDALNLHPPHHAISFSLSVTQNSSSTAKRQDSIFVPGPIDTDKAPQGSIDQVATYEQILGQLLIYTAALTALLLKRQDSVFVPGPIDTDKAPQGSIDPIATYEQSLGQRLIYTAATAALLIVVALVYRYMKKDPEGAPSDDYEHKAELLDRRWRYGLFDCFGDMNICCLTCCCPAIRWADTMRMAGYLGFWTAFLLFMGLQQLSNLSERLVYLPALVLLIVLIVYRQRQRRLFDMQNGTVGSYAEDCLTYGCCGCCAIVQEARQFEEAWAVDHVAVRQARLQ